MTTNQINDGESVVQLDVVGVAPPWEAFLLPVSVFPIPDRELLHVKSIVASLSAKASASYSLSSEIFIQVEQSDDDTGRALYNQHAHEWIPEIGLGVWPDRDPPHSWTPEDFTSLVPGDSVRILMHQIFRVTTSPQARRAARELLLGFGPVIEILVSGDGEGFLERATTELLPPIKDPSFTCFPFYIPLFERKGLVGASSQQLETWFCGASVYIRESFEDKGILIVSKVPLSPILKQLGGRFESEPEPRWQIPIE